MESLSAVQRLSTHCRRSSVGVSDGVSDGDEERSAGAFTAFERCAQPKGIDRPTAERYGRTDEPARARTVPRMRTPAHPYIVPSHASIRPFTYPLALPHPRSDRPSLSVCKWEFPLNQRSALQSPIRLLIRPSTRTARPAPPARPRGVLQYPLFRPPAAMFQHRTGVGAKRRCRCGAVRRMWSAGGRLGPAGRACVISLESAGCASVTRCRARPAESETARHYSGVLGVPKRKQHGAPQGYSQYPLSTAG